MADIGKLTVGIALGLTLHKVLEAFAGLALYSLLS